MSILLTCQCLSIKIYLNLIHSYTYFLLLHALLYSFHLLLFFILTHFQFTLIPVLYT